MLFDFRPGQLQQFIRNFYGQRLIISRIDVILHEYMDIEDKLDLFEFDEIPLISTQAPILRGGRLCRAPNLLKTLIASAISKTWHMPELW